MTVPGTTITPAITAITTAAAILDAAIIAAATPIITATMIIGRRIVPAPSAAAESAMPVFPRRTPAAAVIRAEVTAAAGAADIAGVEAVVAEAITRTAAA
jgi:hypothetical protein